MNSNDKFNEDPERFSRITGQRLPRRFDTSKSNEPNWTAEERDVRESYDQRMRDQLKPPPFNYAPKLNGILQPEDPAPDPFTLEALKNDCGTSLNPEALKDADIINTKLQIERAMAVLYINRMELTDGQKGRLKQLCNV